MTGLPHWGPPEFCSGMTVMLIMLKHQDNG